MWKRSGNPGLVLGMLGVLVLTAGESNAAEPARERRNDHHDFFIVKQIDANQAEAKVPAGKLFPPDGSPVRVTLEPVRITSYQLGVLEAPVSLAGKTVRLQIDELGLVAESNKSNNGYVLTGVRQR